MAAKNDLGRVCLNAGEGGFNLFHSVGWRFADEFYSDVQRFWANPTGIGCEFTYTFHEALNALADGIVDVEANE
jgi:hypothetical protein